MARVIGLLAGSGRLPVLAAQRMNAAGYRIAAVGLAEEAGPELLEIVPDLVTIPVGDLGGMLAFFVREKVSELVFAGKVHKTAFFAEKKMDMEFERIFANLSQRNDDAILGAVVERFAKAGITVLPQASFLDDLLVPRGVMSRRAPDERERADTSFGFALAKSLGGLDIGQSVVVKGRAVLAVEAVEGTDETIRRGGRYGHGGAVLVKVSKPAQDPRFDLPTVGRGTIDAMLESGVSTLAIEAGATFFIDREDSLARADAGGLAVVALDSTGAY
ncbi:MAG: LpxI family protein [Patescibacteria group bacterium]